MPATSVGTVLMIFPLAERHVIVAPLISPMFGMFVTNTLSLTPKLSVDAGR